MKRLAAIFLACAAIAAAAGAAFVYSGLYDVSATDQHLRATYHVLHLTMEKSIERRARAIEPPALGAPEQVARGVTLFREHCVQCHGAPGVAPEPFALALRPLARPLVRSGRERTPGFLFWSIKHGLKMTGMPAWEFRMDDDDIWAVVAFVRRMPALSPQDYAALQGSRLQRAQAEAPADPERGKRALEQYACVGCHATPGLVGPEAHVGPTLHGIGSRQTIAGVLVNTPANMERWLLAPREVKPRTAMPDLGVTPRDARDMAAHLATLR